MLQEYERHLDTKQVKQKLRHQLRRKVWEYFDTWKDRGRKQGLQHPFGGICILRCYVRLVLHLQIRFMGRSEVHTTQMSL